MPRSRARRGCRPSWSTQPGRRRDRRAPRHSRTIERPAKPSAAKSSEVLRRRCGSRRRSRTATSAPARAERVLDLAAPHRLRRPLLRRAARNWVLWMLRQKRCPVGRHVPATRCIMKRKHQEAPVRTISILLLILTGCGASKAGPSSASNNPAATRVSCPSGIECTPTDGGASFCCSTGQVCREPNKDACVYPRDNLSMQAEAVFAVAGNGASCTGGGGWCSTCSISCQVGQAATCTPGHVQCAGNSCSCSPQPSCTCSGGPIAKPAGSSCTGAANVLYGCATCSISCPVGRAAQCTNGQGSCAGNFCSCTSQPSCTCT